MLLKPEKWGFISTGFGGFGGVKGIPKAGEYRGRWVILPITKHPLSSSS